MADKYPPPKLYPLFRLTWRREPDPRWDSLGGLTGPMGFTTGA